MIHKYININIYIYIHIYIYIYTYKFIVYVCCLFSDHILLVCTKSTSAPQVQRA